LGHPDPSQVNRLGGMNPRTLESKVWKICFREWNKIVDCCSRA
jgi:hypothetical protein